MKMAVLKVYGLCIAKGSVEMINLSTAKKLDKLGITKEIVNSRIRYDKTYGTTIDLKSPTIEELLEKLPYVIDGYSLCLGSPYKNKWEPYYFKKESSGSGEYIIKAMEHKNLAEALARLLIQLTEQGLIN